jgi:hypothetical protein
MTVTTQQLIVIGGAFLFTLIRQSGVGLLYVATVFVAGTDAPQSAGLILVLVAAIIAKRFIHVAEVG